MKRRIGRSRPVPPHSSYRVEVNDAQALARLWLRITLLREDGLNTKGAGLNRLCEGIRRGKGYIGAESQATRPPVTTRSLANHSTVLNRHRSPWVR
jgi:hypothetical protein